MFKTFLRFAAVGCIGLMISCPPAVSGLFGKSHSKDEKRTQVSPACHPTYGYHQTCWRRFPALPPCETCDTCPTGACQDGNCELPSSLAPSLPHPISPVPSHDSHFAPGLHSGRYGASTSAPAQPAAMSQQAASPHAVAANSVSSPGRPAGGSSMQMPSMTTGRYGQAFTAASTRTINEATNAANPTLMQTPGMASGRYGIVRPVASPRPIGDAARQATTSQSQRYQLRVPAARPAVASRSLPAQKVVAAPSRSVGRSYGQAQPLIKTPAMPVSRATVQPPPARGIAQPMRRARSVSNSYQPVPIRALSTQAPLRLPPAPGLPTRIPAR